MSGIVESVVTLDESESADAIVSSKSTITSVDSCKSSLVSRYAAAVRGPECLFPVLFSNEDLAVCNKCLRMEEDEGTSSRTELLEGSGLRTSVTEQSSTAIRDCPRR